MATRPFFSRLGISYQLPIGLLMIILGAYGHNGVLITFGLMAIAYAVFITIFRLFKIEDSELNLRNRKHLVVTTLVIMGAIALIYSFSL